MSDTKTQLQQRIADFSWDIPYKLPNKIAIATAHQAAAAAVSVVEATNTLVPYRYPEV